MDQLVSKRKNAAKLTINIEDIKSVNNIRKLYYNKDTKLSKIPYNNTFYDRGKF